MGPLAGIKVVEFAGLGPAPFCAMLLADMGAEVVCIARKSSGASGGTGNAMLDHLNSRACVLNRGRRRLELDLKAPETRQTVLELLAKADVLIEGFRPGVMERLGLGPDECLARNPKLIYGRMTGWGQNGPLAQAAGHDINYIAISGALNMIGEAGGAPVAPPGLVGDFGGGGMVLAFGILAALLEAKKSGQGQVVDAAISDGAAMLTAMLHGFRHDGLWSDSRGENAMDGASHFYGSYQCQDGHWVAIGSLEPQFYAILLEKCGLSDDPDFKAQMDPKSWPRLKAKLTEVFKSKTRNEWCSIMEGSDVCFAPVMSMGEAPQHPHNKARETFVEIDGVVQPAPAPRFSRTPAKAGGFCQIEEDSTETILADWGVSADEGPALKEDCVI